MVTVFKKFGSSYGNYLIFISCIFGNNSFNLSQQQTRMAEDILTGFEINKFLEDYVVSKLNDIAKKRWFNKCAFFMKLYQVATLEASLDGTYERVKDVVLKYSKINDFIKELIVLSVWKEKVVPELLQLQPMPQHSLPTYIVLYHEVALVGLLQSLLFHSSIFKDIHDSTCIDLVDYCVFQLTTTSPEEILITSEMKIETNALEDIQRQNKNLTFIVSTQCVSLLRFICENLDNLPLNVACRIYSTHDLPILITHLIDSETWSRRINGRLYKFMDNNWREWFPKDPPLSNVEVQTWLLAHQLLLHSNSCIYTFSNYRKEQLSRLLRHLHDSVLDQLSPLADLKKWLHTNSLTADEGPRVHNPLILEITPQYRDVICNEYEGKWKEIAVDRSRLLFYGKVHELQFLAKGFSSFLENIEKVREPLRRCLTCYSKAFKKCSKCKTAWYCSRECQIEHWSAHKHLCK